MGLIQRQSNSFFCNKKPRMLLLVILNIFTDKKSGEKTTFGKSKKAQGKRKPKESTECMSLIRGTYFVKLSLSVHQFFTL